MVVLIRERRTTVEPNKTKMPPVKDRSQDNLESNKYDSISAITKDTRVYMLYETELIQPMWLSISINNYLKINDYI